MVTFTYLTLPTPLLTRGRSGTIMPPSSHHSTLVYTRTRGQQTGNPSIPSMLVYFLWYLITLGPFLLRVYLGYVEVPFVSYTCYYYYYYIAVF